ncbi:MAG: hypothetical protein IMF00_05110 [Proteobacteria bacterium]|nr:hypothetical protein [Pseudomonadota bacterium]
MRGESQPFSAIEQLVARLIAVGCRGTDYGFRVQRFRVQKFKSSGNNG